MMSLISPNLNEVFADGIAFAINNVTASIIFNQMEEKFRR